MEKLAGDEGLYLLGLFDKHSSLFYLFLNDEYCTLSSIVHTFYIENDAEVFPAHSTWKVAEKGFKMAFMMNKLAMINSCEIILEK